MCFVAKESVVVSYKSAVSTSVIAWLLKLQCCFVSVIGCLMFPGHILYFKENYKFRVKVLSLAYTEDEGETKFRKELS